MHTLVFVRGLRNPKLEISSAVCNNWIKNVFAYIIRQNLICAFPSSISRVATNATGNHGGVGTRELGFVRICRKTKME
jgi:hypothetical protein